MTVSLQPKAAAKRETDIARTLQVTASAIDSVAAAHSLGRVALALERIESMLATCAAALWHQDYNIDSDIAVTIDGVISEQLDTAQKNLQEAIDAAGGAS